MPNELTRLAKMLLEIDEDLPLRLERDTDKKIRENPTVDDFEVVCFEQTWPDTSCGFGGIAGQMITAGYTVVLRPNGVTQPLFVYFNGKYAYKIPIECEDKALEDIRNYSMAPVYKRGKYLINEHSVD